MLQAHLSVEIRVTKRGEPRIDWHLPGSKLLGIPDVQHVGQRFELATPVAFGDSFVQQVDGPASLFGVCTQTTRKTH